MPSKIKRLIEKLFSFHDERFDDSFHRSSYLQDLKGSKAELHSLLTYYRLNKDERISNFDLIYFQKFLDENVEQNEACEEILSLILGKGEGENFFLSTGYFLRQPKSSRDRIIQLRVYFWLCAAAGNWELKGLDEPASQLNKIQTDWNWIKENYFHKIQKLCLDSSQSTAPFPGIYGQSLWILSRLVLINSGKVSYRSFPDKEITAFFQYCFDIGSSPPYGLRIVELVSVFFRRYPLDHTRLHEVTTILSCYIKTEKNITKESKENILESLYILELLTQADNIQ